MGNLVNADATHEVIQRYLIAAKVNCYGMADQMGRSKPYIYGVQCAANVRLATERAIFDWIDQNWPQGEPKPRILIDFKTHRDRVAKTGGIKPPPGRPCMTCRTPFDSAGPHNRLCPTCSRRASALGAEFA